MFTPCFMNCMARFSCLARHVQHRAFSLKPDNLSLTNHASFNPFLRATIRQLDAIAPRFEISGAQIEILDHPADFYTLLKARILAARSRVFLSSLYIGRHQRELVECVGEAMERTPELKVSILLDCLRSTRDSPADSTASLLAPLVAQYGDRIDVRLYHTPKLHGFMKMVVPRRFNEGFGLQHMKIYGFDNDVMLSGANLSEDYFTNRQDRYYLFHSRPMADYYFRVQAAVSLVSYRLLSAPQTAAQYVLDWPETNQASEPMLNVHRFVQDCNRVLIPVLRGDGRSKEETNNSPDTLVYAVSSFSPLLSPDFSTEKPALLRILSFLDDKAASFTFTAGYFNMHKDFLDRISSSQASGRVITAAPEANSFYKSKGVSKYVPPAYLYNAKRFLENIHKVRLEDRVKLLEWQRGVIRQPGGWSYHAKGIWISLPHEKEPSITVIGSSNYTKRAYSLDLETNAVVVTKDPQLKARMAKEITHLCKHTTELTLKDFEKPERRISPGVKLATHVMGNML